VKPQDIITQRQQRQRLSQQQRRNGATCLLSLSFNSLHPLSHHYHHLEHTFSSPFPLSVTACKCHACVHVLQQLTTYHTITTQPLLPCCVFANKSGQLMLGKFSFGP
jgi:hypothetical protein